MNYDLSIDIALPREEVMRLFDDTSKLDQWQPGLRGFKLISGESRQVGAVTKLIYQIGGRHIEMVETVTHQNLPDEFFCTYKTKGIYNEIENYFSAVDANTTRWKSKNVFRLSGFMWLFTPIMKGPFRKQSLQYMEMFKAFAEASK